MFIERKLSYLFNNIGGCQSDDFTSDWLRYNYSRKEKRKAVFQYQKKAGENMPLEAIKMVTETEKLSEEKIAAAKLKAKQIFSDAHQEGVRILKEAEKKAEEENAKAMALAQEDGNKITAELMKKAEQECGDLENLAKSRMEKAVSFITERIVNA